MYQIAKNNPLIEGKGGGAPLFANDFYPSSSIQGDAGRELYFYSVSNLLLSYFYQNFNRQIECFLHQGCQERKFESLVQLQPNYNFHLPPPSQPDVPVRYFVLVFFALFSTAGALVLVIITVSGVSPITE